MDAMIPAWVDGKLVQVEKLDAHKRGLKHKAVSVFLFDGEKVLLQQRALNKYHTPGLWANTCCTHPFWGEDPITCAKRRLMDELCLDVNDLDFFAQVEYRADVGDNLIEHEVVDIFVGAFSASNPIHPNANEVTATRWVTYDELVEELAQNPNAFTPWLKIYVSEHGQNIFDARPKTT